MGCDAWTWSDYDQTLGKLRAAWTAHYVAKGCSVWKASALARKKTHTWPATN